MSQDSEHEKELGLLIRPSYPAASSVLSLGQYTTRTKHIQQLLGTVRRCLDRRRWLQCAVKTTFISHIGGIRNKDLRLNDYQMRPFPHVQLGNAGPDRAYLVLGLLFARDIRDLHVCDLWYYFLSAFKLTCLRLQLSDDLGGTTAVTR